MSLGPVGSYILFPPTLARTDLIVTTLKAMELSTNEFEVRLPDEEGFPPTSEEGYPMRTEEPPERALALLAQESNGLIEGRGSRAAEIFWLEPAVGSYPVINIWVDRVIHYNKYTKDIEAFVLRWLQLCEQGRAVYGYFSPFSFMFERDYLIDQILPAIQQGDMNQLLLERGVLWLIYLGPDLAKRWRQEQSPLPFSPLVSLDLPSGAHFFRTSTEVFG